ncbi:10379_t:CDS:2, partial [Scutellospora calospora]
RKEAMKLNQSFKKYKESVRQHKETISNSDNTSPTENEAENSTQDSRTPEQNRELPQTLNKDEGNNMDMTECVNTSTEKTGVQSNTKKDAEMTLESSDELDLLEETPNYEETLSSMIDDDIRNSTPKREATDFQEVTEDGFTTHYLLDSVYYQQFNSQSQLRSSTGDSDSNSEG